MLMDEFCFAHFYAERVLSLQYQQPSTINIFTLFSAIRTSGLFQSIRYQQLP
jgi:hypothetical protein